MELNLSPQTRKAIYVTVILGTAVIVPLDVANVIPDLVGQVWNSLAGAASLLAAFNVNRSK